MCISATTYLCHIFIWLIRTPYKVDDQHLFPLSRCILDGEMLVWDTSTNRFAEFGSNQEIGLHTF